MLKKFNVLFLALFIGSIITGCNIGANQGTPSATLEPLILPTTANKPKTPTLVSEVLENPSGEEGPHQTTEKAPTPTEVQELIFSPENINLVAPDNIIQELAYFGGLGGGGTWCPSEYQTPSFLFEPDEELVVMEKARFHICGILAGEKVSVQVALPDDSIRSFELDSYKVDENTYGEVSFDYVPNFRDPKGEYLFVFTGTEWSLEKIINVHEPASPKLYLVSNEITLYRFQENEKVRVFVYGNSDTSADNLSLIGWIDYQVNQNGELVITKVIDGIFVAKGEISGIIYESVAGELSPWFGFSDGDLFCEGAPLPIGIIPNQYAEVVVDNLTLYDEKSWAKDQLLANGNLSKGDIVRFWSNARCKNHFWWWAISCLDYSECHGYVQEGDFQTAYLQPVQELPATPTPSTSITQLAPYHPIEGCAASRLQEGMVISLTPGTDYVSIRSEPDTHPSDNKIGRINPGDKATIIGGPECSYGWIMWEVQTEAGIVGWIPESNGEEIWLMAVGN